MADDEPGGRYNVVDPDGGHFQVVKGERLLFVKRVVRQRRRVLRGQAREVRKHDVIEDVAAQPVEHFGERADLHRSGLDPPGLDPPGEVIGQQREAFDVVEVGVREEDVADFALLGLLEPGTDGAGVHHAGFVDEKSASPAFVGAALAVYDGQL